MIYRLKPRYPHTISIHVKCLPLLVLGSCPLHAKLIPYSHYEQETNYLGLSEATKVI